MMNFKLFFLLSVVIASLLASTANALSKADQAMVFESYAFERNGDYNQAISKMVRVLNENKSDYFVNYRLGWLFSMNKKYEDSRVHYEKAAKATPSSIEPWLALSILNLNLGIYAKVLTTSEEVLKRAPTNYDALSRVTTACIQLKKFENGLTKVNYALKLYPLDAIFLEQKGYILNQLNKTAEATKVLEFLFLISPENAYAKSMIGTKI